MFAKQGMKSGKILRYLLDQDGLLGTFSPLLPSSFLSGMMAREEEVPLAFPWIGHNEEKACSCLLCCLKTRGKAYYTLLQPTNRSPSFNSFILQRAVSYSI